jgi:Ran GTPase-activating protein (RanGAP) involved in mRNA processing and transport
MKMNCARKEPLQSLNHQKINSSITSLNLQFSEIGNEGASALAEALKINSFLTTLQLDENDIRNEGSLAIAEALNVYSSLTSLNLF